MKVQKSKLASVFLLASVAAAAGASDLDTASIDSITGLKGKLNSEEGVYKVSQPRTIFLHYWGRGPAATLVEAVKRALDNTKK